MEILPEEVIEQLERAYVWSDRRLLRRGGWPEVIPYYRGGIRLAMTQEEPSGDYGTA
jgi:hypothetical protein